MACGGNDPPYEAYETWLDPSPVEHAKTWGRIRAVKTHPSLIITTVDIQLAYDQTKGADKLIVLPNNLLRSRNFHFSSGRLVFRMAILTTAPTILTMK